MTPISTKQRLNELLAETVGRDNFDELLQHIYDGYGNVDLADSHIKQMDADLEDASGDEQRDLAEKLGILHVARGNYAAAVEKLEGVRNRKTACHFLGRAYLHLGREREALECLEKGRAGDDDLTTDMLMVEAHCRLREYQQAEKLLKQHAGQGDQSADLLCTKGRVAEAKGEYGEAMEYYEVALADEPEHAESLFRLALNCDLNGEDERAVEYYQRCVNLRPTFVGALINLGVLHEDHGMYGEAISCYRRVLAIEPTHKQAQLYLKDAESSLTMYLDVAKSRRLRTMEEIFSLPEGSVEGVQAETPGGPTRTERGELLNEHEMQELLARYASETRGSVGTSGGAPPFPAGEGTAGQEKLSISVEELDLATRARKCMERLGVTTVGELVQLSKKQLLGEPNFGTTSLKEIEGKLAALGLALKDA